MTAQPAARTASDPFARLDATAQAALVREGQVSPRELVDAAIARIERLNPELNAVIIPLFEKARAQAEGPLPDGPFRGVPFAIKDLGCHTAGDPMHVGMRFLKEAGWTEAEDAWLAARFRQAGFVCVGRTNTPELGPMTTTEPVAYGPSRNPWNPAHSTGGSSGGSAAAVASGMVPVAHASDGGGSIRVPASECGLVGLKPSRGRTSLAPGLGESWAGLVNELVVSRSVRDTAAVLDAVAGSAPGDPYTAPPPARPFTLELRARPGRLRIGILAHAPGNALSVHPEVAAAVTGAGQLLAELGHDVEEAFPAALTDEESMRTVIHVVAVHTARDLAYWSARVGRPIGAADVEPVSWAIAEIGRQVSGVDYVLAVERMHRWTREVARFWADGFDLLVTPTIPELPPLLGTFASTPENPLAGFEKCGPFVTFTAPFNVTGQPAVSLPLAWSASGLPIGVQVVGGYGREDLLLRVAAQLEEARPWADRWPACAG